MRFVSQQPVRIRRMTAIAAIVGVAVIGAACSSNSSSPTTTTSGGSTATTSGAPVTLRLGYLTNLTHASALIGVQNGIFKKSLPSNVTLQTSTYNAGPAEVTAMLAGSLDAAYMGPNSAITAYTQSGGKAIRIISGATSGGAALVVSKSITSPNQLKGKTLSTPRARQHPGRGPAHLAEEAGAHLPRAKRGQWRGHHPARRPTPPPSRPSSPAPSPGHGCPSPG